MNMEIKEIILRAVNIIIFPIYILIFINLYKFKKNVFILLNILFNITCMLNSMIFFLPKGETGNSGVYVGTDAPTDPSIMVWIDTDGGGIELEPAEGGSY